MFSPPDNRWLHRFSVLTAVVTLALIGVGGLVTSHGVGMAVPDWPNTYGYNMFLFPFSQWVGGILYEHSHRLVASFVGLLTAALAIWLWVRDTRGKERWIGLSAMLFVLLLLGVRKMPVYFGLAALAPAAIALSLHQISRNTSRLRWWGVIALATVILQGILGGLRVVLFRDELGIFHAALAQLFFVLICAIALFTSRWWSRLGIVSPAGHGASGDSKLREKCSPSPLPSPPGRGRSRILLGTTLLIFVQLIVGATMRHQHAGLAIPDFPLAYGQLWPAMDSESVMRYNQQRFEVVAANPITAFQIGLQMVHRLVALAICVAVGFCAWVTRAKAGGRHPLSKLSLGWFALILLQAVLGAATIWSNKAADLATLHVLMGAVSLATGAMLTLVAVRAAIPVRPFEKPDFVESLAPAQCVRQPSPATGLK